MHRRWWLPPLAALGVATVATVAVLLLTHGDRAISLLIYLPGIVLLAYFHGWYGGGAAVGFSVAGSAVYRAWLLQPAARVAGAGLYRTWEEEIILLVVGLFVVWVMELRRRSGEAAVSGALRFASLLDNIADAALIFDPQLRLVSLNASAANLFDRPLESLRGLGIGAFRQSFHFVAERGSGAGVGLPVESVLEGQTCRQEAIVVDAAHDRRTSVLASLTPLRDAHRRPVGALIILTDVTTLRDLQSRILDDDRQLAAAQLATSLTHDFNHLLDIIRRAVGVLEITPEATAAERHTYLAMMDRAAADGAGMVQRLRDFLTGSVEERRRLELSRLAEEAIELTRPLWRTRPEVVVTADIEEEAVCEGNANELRRVLVNLILNALDALGSQGGRVAVHTSARGGIVRCSVEDSGSGIPLEAQRLLFQPYFTTKARGTGLGLFGAQRIIKMHGGNLTYFSQPGRGTRFNIELPAARPQAA